jgi:hypothetical protein
MSPTPARRARWAGAGVRSLPFAVAVLILLGGLLPPAPDIVAAREALAVRNGPSLIQLTAVAVEQRDEVLTVHLQTGGRPTYSATSLDAPARIVIDLKGARYAWCGPLTANPAPIREVRGSQWKPGVTRVVVELSRPVGYSVEERPDGLVLRLDPEAGDRAARTAQLQPSPVVEGASAGLVAPRDPTPLTVGPRYHTIKGHVEVGYRRFLMDREQGLADDNVDVEGELDYTLDLNRALRLRLHPRVAIDPLEKARNRFEPYDAYMEYTAESWALLGGQFIESWSAVETFSPADLLNRRDLERNFYDPQKLGELMARLRLFLPEQGWIRQPTFSLYALPLFRRTPLPTNHDRFRFDITGDNVGDLIKDVVEPSFDVGFAARLAATLGSADLSLFYYGGPGRIPSFAFVPTLSPKLMPVYYRADSVGASAQWALGPWVLKGETVYTFTSTSGLPGAFKAAAPDGYFQYVVGVDRTFTDVLGKNEVTLTLEYSGEDNPRVTALTGLRPFKSDLFLAARWQFHDQRRTQIRAFVAADVLQSEQLWLVDFKTAVYGNVKLLLEGQFVNRGKSTPPDHLSVFGLFPNNASIRVALRYEF